MVGQWPPHLEEPWWRRRSAEKSQREAPASCPPSAEMVQVSTHQDWVSAVMHGPRIPGLCCLGARHGKKQVQFRCSDGSPVKTLCGEVKGMREMVVPTREQQEGCWARCHTSHNDSHPSRDGCHRRAHRAPREHTLVVMDSSHSSRIAMAPISEMRKPRHREVSNLPTGPQAVRGGLGGGSWHIAPEMLPQGNGNGASRRQCV